jgi:ATP-dependent Clp protease protease subunit
MPQLKHLLITNRGKGFFRADTSTDGEEATIYLYDAITDDDYWGGVSPMSFIMTLAAITAPTVHLRINSPGGDVFAARAICQAIKEFPGQIVGHIDGCAASAATMIAIACSDCVIADGGMFMIHNAWVVAAGNANDFTTMANLLGRVDQTLCNDYVAKTGQTPEQIKEWMDAETYFFGQEAVDAGFVSGVAAAAPEPDAPQNKIQWDLSAYAKAPKPQAKTEPPAPEPKPEPTPEPENKIIDLSNYYRRLALVEKTAA